MTWRLARSLDTLRSEVRSEWPGTVVWTIGDTAHASRASDHNPSPAGVVCAVDIVGVTQAKATWDRLLASRDPRIKYLIHDRKIVSSTVSPWQVRPYTGSNPHLDHLHVSVGTGPDGSGGSPELSDDPSPWTATVTTTSVKDDDMALSPEAQQWLEEFYAEGVKVQARPSSLFHVLRWMRDLRESMKTP